jgi:cell division protein FtsB
MVVGKIGVDAAYDLTVATRATLSEIHCSASTREGHILAKTTREFAPHTKLQITNDSAILTFRSPLGLYLPKEMSKKRISAEKLARVEFATRCIQWMNRGLYLCVAVAFGLLIAATAAPQKKEYEKLQAQLRTAQEREQEMLARKEHQRIELQALREDTAYLEVQARDRLNFYREGERVLRFDSDR